MMTQRKIYTRLRKQFLKDYRGHFRDMYEGHNHAERSATAYAIKNTIFTWKEQWK